MSIHLKDIPNQNIDPIDIPSRKKEIKTHLKSGKLERAIKRLVDLVDDHFPDTEEEDAAINIICRFNMSKTLILNGELSHEQRNIQNNSLIQPVLSLLRQLPNKAPIL